MRKIVLLSLVSYFSFLISNAQTGYWQQKIKYVMDVDLDVATNKMTGKQQIIYTNNSPDTLKKLFVHLFWNAFQPGSMTDMAIQNADKIVLGVNKSGKQVTDFDPRFKKRINEMKPEEQGYCHVTSFLVNGQ